jgi:uncharacterized protein YbaP (TraB family)
MKRITSIILSLVLLLTLACMAGCDSNEPVVTEPTAAPTDAPTDPAPTLSVADRFAAAMRNLGRARNLVISYTSSQDRTVSGETFTAKTEGTASYRGLQAAHPQALIRENLTYGTYSTVYYQSYLNDAAFCRVSNSNFTADLTIDQFLDAQLPIVLLDPDLYGSVTELPGEDGSVIMQLEDPSALESWVTGHDSAQLVAAYGTATMSEDNRITAFTYHAEYAAGTTAYVTDITVSIQFPESLDLSAQHPVYPENCPSITDLRIPKLLLQTVGDVYTAQAMTVSYNDTIHSQAFNQIRSQNNMINTFGSGDSFSASINSRVTLKDFSGIPTTNAQTIRFLDGVYSYSINGTDYVPDTTITAEAARTMCEDSILSGLMTFGSIAGAEILDTGDFLCITFTGNEEFAETICAGIYSLFGMDLDTFAASYTTDSAGGYLTINKYTGLATAMGISMKRTHIIDSVPYTLTYQVDQGLTIPSAEAYENITGRLPEDPGSTEPIAPLFYKVTDSDGHTMWLLGTLDIGDSRSSLLPQYILDALNSADALAVSYDPDRFLQQLVSDSALSTQLTEAYYYANGGTTKSNLPADLYDLAHAILLATGNHSINTPYMKVVLWESMISDLYLSQSGALSAKQSIDRWLLTQAAGQEKPIYEIESGLTHLQLASQLSKDLQAAMLRHRIEVGLLGTTAHNQALYEAWCAGDEAALLELLTVDESGLTDAELQLLAEYRAAMNTKHNKALLKAAKAYLSGEETVFYAVDIAHVLGTDGLIAALQDAGFTVEAVIDPTL